MRTERHDFDVAARLSLFFDFLVRLVCHVDRLALSLFAWPCIPTFLAIIG